MPGLTLPSGSVVAHLHPQARPPPTFRPSSATFRQERWAKRAVNGVTTWSRGIRKVKESCKTTTDSCTERAQPGVRCRKPRGQRERLQNAMCTPTDSGLSSNKLSRP
ncbi:hypothetical protein K437DRAFT_119187 [Tilletiaria anomala UBC 951]|uniref:Uncharacterized protein n=1 Tax=Tilletiaria anomala (strain ATCC 24038 / CBS 436.72 / UBC 951) TaxID=1037660 RepID=A0A066VZP9_TILAU|nr:uncharacterized protein K437DRAFT_119187 [Tilletiaria anomala UBC 951]KDN45763.1 hypothetical protein K437DRAFT_119187 [Tilletiaria anomala UBC 951]